MIIMSFLGTIKNTLTTTKGNIINNAVNNTDRGVGGYGVTLQSGTETTTLKNLQDLTIVDKTINNARLAVEIDPTVFSSVMAATILTNKEFDIVGDPDADPDAVEYIKKKVKDWNLESSMITTTWKGLIDGRCFIETYLNPGMTGIDSISHLAFDEDYYNFVQVIDPLNGQVMGYKQRAKIYPLPANWESMAFDQYLNRAWEWKDITFTRNPQTGWLPVFMPTLFQGDGNSEGFVFKVLDDVYCLKSIKNIMPDAAKMAANTVKVQVGNKDFPFKPYNDTDTVDEKISKSTERMEDIGGSFKEKFKKQVILHDGSVTADMLGNGQLPELERYINLFKQEIRAGLQTPDSRFESASSNRAVAEEQLSGDTGQTKILDHFRNQFLRPSYERNLFDYELQLAGYESSMGLVHISYEEANKEDEVSLAQTANVILQIRPDLFEKVAPLYFPRIAPVLDETDLQGNINPVDESVVNSMGIKDTNNPASLVYDVKKSLIKEGLSL